MHVTGMPVTIELVRQLVDAQFPHLAIMPLRSLDATGSSNFQFRLGDDLIVRLPRLPNSSATIEKEAYWTPIIGKSLPVAVPVCVGVGEPAFDYSEKWSIVRWLDGQHPSVWTPAEAPTNSNSVDQSQLAKDLADVILALRSIDVSDAALRESSLKNYRGRPLENHDRSLRENIEQCRAIDGLELDLDAALDLWEEALSTSNDTGIRKDRWYHGDLVAENLLLTNDRLTAILDLGGLGVGDPTIDLIGAWELLDPPARDILREKVAVSDAEWMRGRAWALAVAIMTFPYYWNTMSGRVDDRLAMARSVLANE